MEYLVVRQHYGDREYFEGDTRTLDSDADAKHLLKLGLIAKPEEKKETKKVVAKK